MPDLPFHKIHPHPAKRTRHDTQPKHTGSRYTELQVTTNFSFLRGASHPDELVEQAARLGYDAIAITDRNTLAGIVRAHAAARHAAIRLIVGCRLLLEEAPEILVFPTNRASYARLCRLLTIGKRRAPKGECHLRLHDLLALQHDLLAVVLPSNSPNPPDDTLIQTLVGLRDVFDDDRLSLASSCLYTPDDQERLERTATLAAHTGIPLAATNDVHYHTPERRPLQDVVTCIREGVTLDRAGALLFPHAERSLKPPDEMLRLFAQYPDAIARTAAIAERAGAFSLDQIVYEYPEEVCPDDKTPIQHLRELAYRGAAERFGSEQSRPRRLFEPGGAGEHRDVSHAQIPYAIIQRLEHELALIDELGYAKYFLTVYDIVEFARTQNILCQGRGAAANSTVCYCLGVTAVDPARVDLLFERFISKERDEPPDIDIDFEHERREEVIQYIYKRFGRQRAALTAEVITYRGRSAVRDVGKTLGLSQDLVDTLAREIDRWSEDGIDEQMAREIGLDPNDATIQLCAALTQEIVGFPRHLSQHVGGFVMTQGRLDEIVPIENAAMDDRTVIEWDKDDIDEMGILKVDCLGLGMLTCIRKALDLVNEQNSTAYTIATIPPEDIDVYDMICDADTIGVFQIESRAQMSMLPRLRPRCYYDLVIEVAIVRPGPIQGNMVHPYLRRRNGEEPVEFPSPDVRDVLQKTLGVPLFQEQAMRLAIVAAGFTPGEADQLRRAMAAWKRKGTILEKFGQRIVKGMLDKGYTRDFAERCFEQIKGFGDYGFPESHAASFALLVYVSCWLKRYHPAAFAASLINSQPMGFYAPAQIIRDARDHGVDIRQVDVNASAWDCTLEPDGQARDAPTKEPDTWGHNGPAIRLGMRLVKGLSQEHADAVHNAAQAHGPFESIERLWRASNLPVRALRTLAGADAFRSMNLDRRRALWMIRALRDDQLPLLEQQEFPHVEVKLPTIRRDQAVRDDYRTTGLSLRAHPLSFLRTRLERSGVRPAAELMDEPLHPQGSRIAVAGVVLMRQRPGTAGGITFMTLEDESGIANLIVRPKVFKRDRRAARAGRFLIAEGKVERQGQVVHVLASRIELLEQRIGPLGAVAEASTHSRDFH